MAHNINFNNGKHSFFTVKEKAWHGLGRVVEDCPTSSEAIRLAGLDYTVEKQQVYMKNRRSIPGKFATVRKDTGDYLGLVGSRYEPLQNINAFDFFDSIVGHDEAIFETAGALGLGETIFITAKLPSHIKVGKSDLIDQYIFLTNSHDGTSPVTAAFTPVRVVCNNTLNAALGSCSNKITICHTKTVADKVEEAHKMMGIINQLSVELEQVFNQLAKTPCVDERLRQIIVETFAHGYQLEKLGNNEEVGVRFENLVSDVYAYALGSDTQQLETTRGTMFGAYNAVTGYIQNVQGAEVTDKDKFLNSILRGTAQSYAQRAFNLCLSNV